jgi:hypothetical protein
VSPRTFQMALIISPQDIQNSKPEIRIVPIGHIWLSVKNVTALSKYRPCPSRISTAACSPRKLSTCDMPILL